MQPTSTMMMPACLLIAVFLHSSCKTADHGWFDSAATKAAAGPMPPSINPVSAPTPAVPSLLPKVEALTKSSTDGGVLLFVYAEQAATQVNILTAEGWYPLPYAYAAQTPHWSTIRSIYASREWANGQRVRVQLKFADGTTTETDAPIEHR